MVLRLGKLMILVLGFSEDLHNGRPEINEARVEEEPEEAEKLEKEAEKELEEEESRVVDPMDGTDETPHAPVVDQTDGSPPALVVGTPPRGMTKPMAAKKGVDTPPRGRKKANNPHKFTMPPPEKGYVYHHSGFPLLSWK
ncbi:hypothetical protein F2Q70_00020780 [Brassica cretica]|uniref:AT-hook motif nuclear-localized protein n=1 Tax=Brassica cretica TaxID=69181 RepID=A0A8S9HGU9_BRACR|nr:hypothetical protein F2Q70_00020780 [Brassica cretica]KAF2555442.1 hypothetical protein F2Q68_00014252 [Brassica cretica]